MTTTERIEEINHAHCPPPLMLESRVKDACTNMYDKHLQMRSRMVITVVVLVSVALFFLATATHIEIDSAIKLVPNRPPDLYKKIKKESGQALVISVILPFWIVLKCSWSSMLENEEQVRND